VGEVTDILKVFSDLVCYNTQAMAKFQVMNFLHVTLLTPRFFEMASRFLENLWTPSHNVYM